LKSSKPPVTNLLALRPVRNSAWVAGSSGRVAIERPRFRSRWALWCCRLLRMRPEYKLRLDDHGSALWHLCDGSLTVGEIGERLRARFGEAVEPVHERLETFIGLLDLNEFITFADEPEGEATVGGALDGNAVGGDTTND